MSMEVTKNLQYNKGCHTELYCCILFGGNVAQLVLGLTLLYP